MLNHPGSHRIEFNVTHTGKKVIVIGYQAPLMPTFPQGPTLVVSAINIGHVMAADKLNNLAN